VQPTQPGGFVPENMKFVAEKYESLNPVMLPAASVVKPKNVEPKGPVAELLESIVTSPSVKLNDMGTTSVSVVGLLGMAVATVELPVIRHVDGQVADPKNSVKGLAVYV